MERVSLHGDPSSDSVGHNLCPARDQSFALLLDMGSIVGY